LAVILFLLFLLLLLYLGLPQNCQANREGAAGTCGISQPLGPHVSTWLAFLFRRLSRDWHFSYWRFFTGIPVFFLQTGMFVLTVFYRPDILLRTVFYRPDIFLLAVFLQTGISSLAFFYVLEFLC
jgi:hypothetical protein